MRVLVYSDPDTVHTQRFLRALSQRATVGLYWPRKDSVHAAVRDLSCGHIIRDYPMIRIWDTRFRRLREAHFVIGARLALSLFMPDLLHVHVNARVCPRFKVLDTNLPCVFTAWGHIPSDLLAEDYGRAFSAVDAFTADSAEVADELRSAVGCAKKPAHIFRWGVDQDRFRRVAVPRQLRDRLGITDNAKVVFSPRSLRDIYNHESLLGAAPRILREVPNIYFVFTNNHGHRYPDAPAYEARLRTLAASLGIEQHIRILPFQSHKDMPAFYSLSAVTVSIPVEDAFPATIFEAMACESPLVVSDLRDYLGVVDDSNAIRVDPRDCGQIAQGVITLLLDDQRRAAVVQRGLETVKQHGILEDGIGRLIAFYETIIWKRAKN